MAEKSAPIRKLVVEEIGLEVGKSNSTKPVAAPAECSIQKHLLYIDAGSLADHLPILHEPRAGCLAADFLEVQKEIHAGVELAGSAERAHLIFRADHMHVQVLEPRGFGIAHALSLGAVLATDNEVFRSVPGLDPEDSTQN